MAKKPLVTIIIPAYNVEDYIESCLESSLKQTYKQIEILVVDDGSTDNTKKICDAYASKNNNVIVIHKKNGGLSSARNEGIRRATGDYVMFLDGDDELEHGAVGYMIDSAISNSADIIACNFYSDSNESGKGNGAIHVYTREEALASMTDLGSGFAPNVCNKLFRRSLFSNDCLFPSGKLYEDMIVTVKTISKSSRVVYIERNLYFYRVRENSITKKYNEKEKDHIEMSGMVLDFVARKHPAVVNAFMAYHAINQLSVINKVILSNKKEPEIMKGYRQYVRGNKKIILADHNLSSSKKVQIMMSAYVPKLYYVLIRVVK